MTNHVIAYAHHGNDRSSHGVDAVEIDGVPVPGEIMSVEPAPMSYGEHHTVAVRVLARRFETLPASERPERPPTPDRDDVVDAMRDWVARWGADVVLQPWLRESIRKTLLRELTSDSDPVAIRNQIVDDLVAAAPQPSPSLSKRRADPEAILRSTRADRGYVRVGSAVLRDLCERLIAAEAEPRVVIERDGVRIEADSLDDLGPPAALTLRLDADEVEALRIALLDFVERWPDASAGSTAHTVARVRERLGEAVISDSEENARNGAIICDSCGAALSPADGGELGRHDDGCIVAALDPERRRSDARMIDEARAAARGVEERQRRIDAVRAAAGVAPGEALLGLRLPETPGVDRPALAALLGAVHGADDIEIASALLDALDETLGRIVLPDLVYGSASAALPYRQLIGHCRATLRFAAGLRDRNTNPDPEEGR